MISLANYYKQILDIFKFEPKKQYVKELEYTDESDATSISDISDENKDGEDKDEYENPTVNKALVALKFSIIIEKFTAC